MNIRENPGYKFRDNEYDTWFAQRRTKFLWEKEYPEEIYDRRISAEKSSNGTLNREECKIRKIFDLLEFLAYQTELQHYGDIRFISDSFKRYHDFMEGLISNSDHCITLNTVPSFDVFLVWLVHAINPWFYKMFLKELSTDIKYFSPLK